MIVTVFPDLSPVTLPVELTLAYFGLLEVQISVLSDALSGETVAVS